VTPGYPERRLFEDLIRAAVNMAFVGNPSGSWSTADDVSDRCNESDHCCDPNEIVCKDRTDIGH